MVKRESALEFVVRNEGEHGTFFLKEGVGDNSGEPQHWCVLVCHTTFGTVGHTWNNMGSPAKEFLSSLSKDYLLDKLWGQTSRLFDHDATVKVLKQLVADSLREELADDSRFDAAELAFDELDHCTTTDQFYAQVGSAITDVVEYGDMPIKWMLNPQAVGFWEKLWPEFLKGLNLPTAV